MARRKMPIEIAMTANCPRCGQGAGSECRTATGKPVPRWRLYADDYSDYRLMPGVHSVRLPGHSL